MSKWRLSQRPKGKDLECKSLRGVIHHLFPSMERISEVVDATRNLSDVMARSGHEAIPIQSDCEGVYMLSRI